MSISDTPDQPSTPSGEDATAQSSESTDQAGAGGYSQPGGQPQQQPSPQQHAYPPQQPYGQQPYGQPAYGQQPYGQPVYQQPQYQQQAHPQQPYQPQPYYGQTGYYNPPGAFYIYDTGPDNGLAVASLSLGIIAIALMFFTAGFSAPLSIICSIVGVVLGLKGKKAVDEGRTRKHRDVAVAGFWTSIAGIVLAVVAIVGWALIFTFADSSSTADPGDAASIARSIIDAVTALAR